MQRIYIFWDNSNTYIPAREVAARRDGISQASAVRLQFHHLYRLAAAGREVVKTFCVGSVPPDLGRVCQRLRADTGADIEFFERGEASGQEQAVDQALQVRMLRALTDEPIPQVAVLLTGDGAGRLNGTGYFADLERMHRSGWGVEVLSWDTACNRHLKEWVRRNGVYIPLDLHYRKITFLEGGRTSEAPNFTNRPVAVPRAAA